MDVGCALAGVNSLYAISKHSLSPRPLLIRWYYAARFLAKIEVISHVTSDE